MPRATAPAKPHPPALTPQARIVPLIVEYDAFWTRYFYRLHRLQQKHAQFAQLTQRSLALQQEEEEVRARAATGQAVGGTACHKWHACLPGSMHGRRP